jgi:hypothetical protein
LSHAAPAARTATITDELRSILLGTAGPTIAFVVAATLDLSRGAMVAARRATLGRVALVATVIQAAHFGEELATGFHRRFPELLGLVPWSSGFFVTFNVFWLAVWGLCGWGLAVGRGIRSFPLWFLAIAGMANGVAHPALALRTGGYFPGLVTAPFLGVAGLRLWRCLLDATAGRESPTAPPRTAARSSLP